MFTEDEEMKVEMAERLRTSLSSKCHLLILRATMELNRDKAFFIVTSQDMGTGSLIQSVAGCSILILPTA